MPASTDFGIPTVQRRADNVLVRFTSSRRYKTDITDATLPDRLLDLRLREYTPVDTPSKRVIGLIAEEVDDLGLGCLMKYDTEGRAEGVSYDLIGALLVPVIRDLSNRVAILEGASDG